MNARPITTAGHAGDTRQMGHAIGATIGATVLGLAIPVTIDLMSPGESQAIYREGFRYSALAVVWIMISGSVVPMFQRTTASARQPRIAESAPQAAGDG